MQPKPKPTTIPLDQLVFDHDLQMRAGDPDADHIDSLADYLAEDASHHLDPIVAFLAAPGDRCYISEEQPRYYVADGFHRGAAYRITRGHDAVVPTLPNAGGRAAALLHAYGANADQQAKPRTRKDLRKAVTAALYNVYFSVPKKNRPNQQHIAEICRTTQATVSRIAKDIEAEQASKTKQPPATGGQGTEPGQPPAAPEQLVFEFKSEIFSHLQHAVEVMKSQDERVTLMKPEDWRELRDWHLAQADELGKLCKTR